MSPQIVLDRELPRQTLPSATERRVIDAAELAGRLGTIRADWKSAGDIDPQTVSAVLGVIDEILDITTGEL